MLLTRRTSTSSLLKRLQPTPTLMAQCSPKPCSSSSPVGLTIDLSRAWVMLVVVLRTHHLLEVSRTVDKFSLIFQLMITRCDTTGTIIWWTALHVIWDEMFIAKLLESRAAVAVLFQQCRKAFPWTIGAYWVECG